MLRVSAQANRAFVLPRVSRSISSSSCLAKKGEQVPPRPTLPDHELEHTFVKGSGPGGQKINKTNSAAQITHLPTGIVMKSQATRSKSQNYTIARKLLAEKIEFLQKGDESRAAKKEERVRKKKASASKKSKRKYRKLDGEKGGSQDGENVVDEEVEDDAEVDDQVEEEGEAGPGKREG